MEENVYVGGFLCVYRSISDTNYLYVPKSTVTASLNFGEGNDVPLNINHNEVATVGYATHLFDLDHGLFFIGKILSQKFLNIVRETAHKSKLVIKGPNNNLPPDATLEFLNSIFPGLSLSSRADVHSPISEDSPFIHHVSICGVGRRPGTIAIYGRNVEWILDKFTTISEEERSRVLQTTPYDKEFNEDLFSFDLYDMLADSLDTSYIKDRISKLRSDKQISGISNTTYIKASKINDQELINNTHTGGYRVDTVTTEYNSVNVNENEPKIENILEESISSMSQISSNNTSTTSPFSDCVYLPKDTFFSLLNVTSQSQKPSRPVESSNALQLSESQPRMAPMFGSVVPATCNIPNMTNGYQYLGNLTPSISPMNPPDMYYMGPPYVSDQYCVPWKSSPYFDPRFASGNRLCNKRRYVQSDSDEEMSFPGDSDYVDKRRRKVKMNENKHDICDNTNNFKELVSAITTLKNEIASLKQTRDVPQMTQVSLVEPSPNTEGEKIENFQKPIINASYTPEVEIQRSDNSVNSNSLLKLNKQLFVNALNKIEI